MQIDAKQSALQGSLPVEFNTHRAEVSHRLGRALDLVNRMLADPDLADPLLEPNFFIDFKRLSELVLNVEDSSLLILKRCSPDDRFLSALLQQICREVGYKHPAPLCGALSFQYFQALMGMDIIMTPQIQASELLAMPDLYHELAHFVLFRQRDEFEQQTRDDGFVSRAVSAAWQAFQQDAEAFPTFELSAVEHLKNRIVPA